MSNQTPTATTSSASTTPEESTTEKSSPDTQTPNPTPTEPTTGQQEDSPQPPEQESDDTSKAGREAARYRVRLREVEAERDALQAKFEATIDNVVNEKLRNTGIPVRMLRKVEADLGSVYADDGSFSDENLLDLVNHTISEMGLEPSRTLKAINHTYQRIGRIDWNKNPEAGIVPSSGTGPERPLSSDDWGKIIQG